jgi:fatty-acyl-CoA synthase
MGQQVKAVVRLQPGIEGDDDTRAALLAHLDGTLARYKRPRSIDFVDTLPRTPTGKLLKRELVDHYRKAVTT